MKFLMQITGRGWRACKCFFFLTRRDRDNVGQKYLLLGVVSHGHFTGPTLVQVGGWVQRHSGQNGFLLLIGGTCYRAVSVSQWANVVGTHPPC